MPYKKYSSAHKRSFGLLVVVIVAGIAGELHAEPSEPVDLGEIVVSATRTEMDADLAPGSVSVITKEEIGARNIKTVDEAINLTSGVAVTRSKGLMDTHATVQMRGFKGQNRTLVLLDGVVLNDSYSGGILWPAISPENLERIEVVKGPSSNLYGGYAMGGVINLITRMPERREVVIKGGYGGGLGGSDAMEATRKVFVSYGDRVSDRFSYYFSNDYLSTDGYSSADVTSSSPPGSSYDGWAKTTDRTGSAKYLIGKKGENSYWHDNFALKMRYDFSSAYSASMTFMRSENKYDYSEPISFLVDSGGQPVWYYGSVKEASFLSGPGGDEQYILNLGFQAELPSVRLITRLSYYDQSEAWYVTPNSKSATRSGGPGKYTDTPSSAYSLDIQAVMPLSSRNMLTLGGWFRNGRTDSREFSLADWRDEGERGVVTGETKGRERVFALFVQDEISLLDNLTLYTGIRHDWWETYDGSISQISPILFEEYRPRSKSMFSPKGALVYKPFDETTIKLSAGRAFRAPSLYELYRTIQDHGGKTTAGNPDLKPETAVSWDAGIKQGLWRGAEIGVVYYENYIDDMIYSKTITPSYTTKVNAGSAESKGIELEFEQKIDSGLRFFANYTYTDAVIKENDASPSSVGKKVTGIPPHMVGFGVEINRGAFGGMLSGRYADKRYGDDTNADVVDGVYGAYDEFFVVDMKLGYKLTSRARVSLSVDNLFDEQYYMYYKAPGRSCYAELVLNF